MVHDKLNKATIDNHVRGGSAERKVPRSKMKRGVVHTAEPLSFSPSKEKNGALQVHVCETSRVMRALRRLDWASNGYSKSPVKTAAYSRVPEHFRPQDTLFGQTPSALRTNTLVDKFPKPKRLWSTNSTSNHRLPVAATLSFRPSRLPCLWPMLTNFVNTKSPVLCALLTPVMKNSESKVGEC